METFATPIKSLQKSCLQLSQGRIERPQMRHFPLRVKYLLLTAELLHRTLDLDDISAVLHATLEPQLLRKAMVFYKSSSMEMTQRILVIMALETHE